MYWDKTGIGQIDQVFSGFKTGNHDNYSYTQGRGIHGFYGEWGVKRC
jgi:hypothetical protein